MMKIKNYIYAVCVLLTAMPALSSCDDFLEVEPLDSRTIEYFYSKPVEAQQALMGIYNGLLPISKYYLLMSDVRSDDTWVGVSSESESDYRALSNFRKYITNVGTIEGAWDDYYEIVARANKFLEKVEGLEFSSNDEGVDVRATFMAEARFLRAFAYFDLVRFFGRVPMVTKTQTVSEAFNTPQSEPEEIYSEVIIPDLQYAIANLKETAYNYKGEVSAAGRATLPAAKALLGRVYWYMAGFPLKDETKVEPAKELLKEVLDYAGAFDETPSKYWAKDAREWAKIWISDNDNKYHIFEIQYANVSGYGNQMIYSSLPKVSSLSHISMSGNSINTTKSLRDTYTMNPDDNIRYRHTVRYNTSSSSSRYFEKFFENDVKRDSLGFNKIDDAIVDRNSFPINYPLIRLEDVMLMYAQLVGNTQEGISLVNKIRNRAGISPLPAALTDDRYQTYVLDERRRELAGEGIRWHDIVRTGQFRSYIEAAYKGESSSSAGSVISNITDGMYLYPIPEEQMLVRTGLYQQNEAYK